MQFPRSIVKSLGLGLVALALAAMPAAAQRGGVFVSVGIAPPAIPVYEQAPWPGEGYIWTPGYWAWTGDEYTWVEGAWVIAPYVGALWTPGYWGYGGSGYFWNAGYWGRNVGYYGGINYGFGYFGNGYYGGRWDHDRFFYDRGFNHIDFRRTNNFFDGGHRGIPVHPGGISYDRGGDHRGGFGGGVHPGEGRGGNGGSTLPTNPGARDHQSFAGNRGNEGFANRVNDGGNHTNYQMQHSQAIQAPVSRPAYNGGGQQGFQNRSTYNAPVQRSYSAPQQSYQRPAYNAPQQNYQRPAYNAPSAPQQRGYGGGGYSAPQQQQRQYSAPAAPQQRGYSAPQGGGGQRGGGEAHGGAHEGRGR